MTFFMYFFVLMIVIIIIQYLPIVTVPAAILSLLWKKNIKRTVIVIVVIALIKLFNNVNRNGRGPSEAEFFLSQLEHGSIWAILSLIGYLYLIYWWGTFLKRRKQGATKEENVGIEEDIARTKKRAKWGCLIWVVILFFGPIFLFAGYFHYQTEIKERTLMVSHSPSGKNTIKIVEKGEPFFFGPSTIKIKYRNQYIVRSISNDGKTLNDSNATVKWKSDDTAIITLYGEEQFPETIEFNKEKRELFENVQIELDSNTLTTSESPDNKKTIEVREIIRSQGQNPKRFLRIYYGDNGSSLNKYKEYNHLDRSYKADQLYIDWTNNTQASIRIFTEAGFEDAVEIDFTK
ncbi:hypothetical protein [Bacillus sp. FJAT-50079]|uniref:hypothetical protein n=1 Tax=Bacillus sp. FJAT-50079 TaxID=2833577 RepID=UPI001BC9ACE8|nr:hypothetical protein [Bacillus sp. FJAT-50079]MBS4208665.1 hypothetical protein [Bacillus sp. FJAT-50079]